MYKKNRKHHSNGNKMPSIFKKSVSDSGTLSESHRKVLHRCRMMLLKDLDVHDILDYMSQEDGFRSDVRDTILSYTERERRVATLLDKLETRGDRAFALFMEAIREHYKHLHYVLEETLRDMGDKDDKSREYRLSITGESVRKVIKNSMRRKTEYSQGSESVDDLDIVFDDREEDAYIDCYSIPMRGRLQRERWIKQVKDVPGFSTNRNNRNTHNQEQSEIEEEEETYMAVVLRDLLFKRIQISEIPAGVKLPPQHCGDAVFIIDTENKYGMVRKEQTFTSSLSRDIDSGESTREKDKETADIEPTLDTQVSHELPDYTAPPPPTKANGCKNNNETAENNSIPPPPLPPKPGNLPPLCYTPSPVLKQKIKEEENDVDSDQVCSDGVGDTAEKKEDSPEPPALPESSPPPQSPPPPPKVDNIQEEIEEEIVRPPPRSTSLSQALAQQASIVDKPLPSPKMGSKFLINKSRSSGSISASSTSSSQTNSRHSSQSPEKGETPSPPASSTTQICTPPVPPRRYLDADSGLTIAGLSGAGAIASPSVAQLSPKTTTTNNIRTGTENLKNRNSADAVKNNTTVTSTLDVKLNQGMEESNKNNKNPRSIVISKEAMDRRRQLEEEEFDPYSMGVDSIFQVSRSAAGAQRHGHVVEANDMAAPKEDSQSSGTGTVKEGNSTATLSKDDATVSDVESLDDVDMPIPVQDEDDLEEEYEAVGHSNAANPECNPPVQDQVSTERNHSRDSTPYDSEDAKRDSQDVSTLDSSFKASGDSLNSNTTPGSQGATSGTTDSGIELQQPPLLIPQRTNGHQRTSHMSSRPLPKDPPLPVTEEDALGNVFILANENEESSDADSYYEDIDVLDKGRLPRIDAGSSEMTSVSYLDPKSYFKAIERMAQQGSCKDSTLKRIVVVEEWEASGRALVNRNELVVADTEKAYTLVKCDDKQASVPVLEGATAASIENVTVSDESDINKHSESEETNISTDSKTEKDVYSEYRFMTIVYDKLGRIFYMPSQYLKRHGDPLGEPWFYPIEISSHQATLFLSAQGQEGCFLVYKPSKRKTNILYNLSVCRGHHDVVHYHIVKNMHDDVMIQGHDHSFLNVNDLVLYFQRNKSQLATKLRRPLREASLPITPGYHYDLRWEISRSHLSLTGKIIGKGNYGVVCAGMYHSNIPVAVKVLQKSDATMQEEDDFIDEAKCLIELNHDHVVRFVGLSCTAKPFFLVYEYLPKGNLRECLQNNIVPSDNIEQLFDLCIQVTSAMNYLESQRYVLHRDIASRNFLVADDLCVKLADFGRARLVNDDNYQAPKTEKIPIKWASPEVLIDSTYSTKSDVWALGVVFWEILSGGGKPYAGLTGEQTAVYVTEGGRLDKPTGCPMDLYNMMFGCWRDSPWERPSFATLYEQFKGKSSIYSSGPIRAEPALPKVKKKDHGTSPAPNRSPPTTPMSFASSSKAKVQRSLSMSNGKKTRHTVMIETHNGGDGSSISYKDINQSRDDVMKGKMRPLSGGSEKLMTSGSETSLNSTLQLPGMDDLTRGDKIRKSIRKIMNIRNTKRKMSKMDGVKEYGNTCSSSKDTTRSPSISTFGGDY